jgi:FMN reductase
MLAGDGLRGTVVVPVVVAGSPVHATMTDLHLRWVLGELGGTLPVPSVVLTERQLAEHDDLAGAVAAWQDAHLAGVVAAVQAGASSRSTTRSANAPALAGTTSR